ncbi:mycofactocin biosynthesis peptidyl-dipeptidase MftE [Gordonia sp. NPDC003376]
MRQPAALGTATWPEVETHKDAVADVTLLVPLGAVEQHGPHLPLDTDTRIAVAIATRAGERTTSNSWVAPELSYGASGEHEGFAGTISLGHEALHQVLLEYGRSACRWAGRIVFVNGHGGNVATVAGAVARLRYEAREVAWYPCAFPDADAHAGHTETSILLHLSPEVVHAGRIEAGNVAPMRELLGAMRAGGVAAVSRNGILGDPRSASADHGARLVDGAVDDLVRALTEWTVDDGGRLR